MGKNGEDFIKVYPFILMLNSKASYKANRENSKIPEDFKIFVSFRLRGGFLRGRS